MYIHEGADDSGVELGSGAALNDLYGFVVRNSGFVDPAVRQGVIDIDDREDAGRKGDVLSGQLVGVSFAVEAFVVMTALRTEEFWEGLNFRRKKRAALCPI